MIALFFSVFFSFLFFLLFLFVCLFFSHSTFFGFFCETTEDQDHYNLTTFAFLPVIGP